jgi:hypothetical protein
MLGVGFVAFYDECGTAEAVPWSFYIFHAAAAWVRPRSLSLTSRCLISSG